jgi:hypothetical protein
MHCATEIFSNTFEELVVERRRGRGEALRGSPYLIMDESIHERCGI